jgi:hypothetical protein
MNKTLIGRIDVTFDSNLAQPGGCDLSKANVIVVELQYAPLAAAMQPFAKSFGNQ